MDRWSGKRAIEVRPDSKKGVGVVLRERFNSNVYSDEKKTMNFTRFVGSSVKKDKSVMSSSRSLSNGKEVTGTSSNIYGSSSSSVKCEKQPLSQISMDSSESSRGSEDELETETLEEIISKGNPQTCHQAQESREQEFHHPGPSGQSASANRGCSPLLSSVIPSGFGLEKRLSRKVDTFNKRKVYGESSSSSSGSGKKITELPSEERHLVFNPRGSLSDSMRARQCVLNVDNDVTSVERSVNRGNSLIRFSNRGSDSRNGLSSVTTTEMSQTETSNNLNSPVSLELFSGFPEFGLSGYNLDGISEILPKLDRIEQDIELNYEQELLIMETGLLLGGLRFYDQHRDMRLDIDNMSYEELLALEERIGTVSTALTEEAISKSLKTSIYQKKPSSYGSVTNSPCDHKEDAKCSICQLSEQHEALLLFEETVTGVIT
ncbi:hypothetical protein Bca101_022548 [Brassica carinata]